MRISFSARVGFILTVAGLLTFGIAAYWFSTRTFFPWDHPVTLERDRDLKADFDVNLAQWYWVEVEVDQSRLPPYAECPADSTLQTRWSLTKNGQAIAPPCEGDGTLCVPSGTFVGRFWAQRGHYEVNVRVVSDASCLNQANPRLQVGISDEDYGDYSSSFTWIVSISLLAAGAGIVLVLRAIPQDLVQPRRSIVPFLSADDAARGWVVSESMWSRRRGRLRIPTREWGRGSEVTWASPNPGGALLSTGLVLPMALLVVLVPWLLLISHQRSAGLAVRIVGPRTVFRRDLGQAILLWIDAKNHWYLNSERVTPEELPAALRSRLGREPSWVVYLDGDSTVEFGEVARAIAILRAEHAQVILLTSRSRQEIDSKSPGKVH